MKNAALILMLTLTTLQANNFAKKEYKSCVGCHGANGEKRAFAKTKPIYNQTKEQLIKKMNGYKNGTLNMYGMGNLKRGMMKKYTKEQMEFLADYITTLRAK